MSAFAGCSFRGSGWAAGGLVVAGGVEGEFAEEFAGGGVDDADVQVLHEEQDAGSGVGSADADVVEASGVAEGDFAVGVDAVGADAVVGVGGAVTGGGFGAGLIGGGGWRHRSLPFRGAGSLGLAGRGRMWGWVL